uniref:hypothetical protein n=1 Tax=Faecalicatena contorta TaxID=39482 RepID=UPI002924A0A8|nr:hypothetical protein AUSP0088_00042 [uncultured phage]
MFFKKKKEIEKLKREIDSLTTANTALTRSNKELEEELRGDYVDSDFCAVCENGIPLKNAFGDLYGAKCALKCECEDFERKPQ